MNLTIQETMPKDRAAASYTQVPAQALGGGNFGELEHYRQAYNAADFGISDGQDRLGPGAMSVVGLPPLNTSTCTHLGLGYRMFNLKAAVLDFDHGLEVIDPNHTLLHAYLLSVSEVYLPHQSPRPGWSKVLLDQDLARNRLRVPRPRVSGETTVGSALTLLLFLLFFSSVLLLGATSSTGCCRSIRPCLMSLAESKPSWLVLVCIIASRHSPY